MMSRIIILVVLSLVWFYPKAQEWGTWFMYFGTNKVSEKVSVHSEFQYRSHALQANNVEQLLPRIGVNYHFNPNASVTIGYAYVPSYSAVENFGAPITTEHRIFEQFILKNKLSRIHFEHRYRVEQRWVSGVYKNRFRYRVMATIPINKPEMDKGTVFVGLYDEIFVNGKADYYDRNRLYAALGYKFNNPLSIQVGALNQALSTKDKWYTQVAVFYNPSLKRSE